MKLIEECKLKYFYQTYGSHNGWLKDVDHKTRKIYLLKNLKPIHALYGEVFHNGVKNLLDGTFSTADPSPDIIKRHIKQNIQLHYQKSQEYKGEWERNPKAFSMITEVYYDSDIQQSTKDIINKKTLCCSGNLFLNRTFIDVLGGRYEIFELDELTEFTFCKVICYLKIDAVLKDQSGKYIVVDWKTSVVPSTEDFNQLLPYVYYLVAQYGVPAEMIEGRLEYIAINETKTYQFSAQDVDRFTEQLYEDIKIIKEFVVPGTENQPVDLEMFNATSSKQSCLNCNFRELCYPKYINMIIH